MPPDKIQFTLPELDALEILLRAELRDYVLNQRKNLTTDTQLNAAISALKKLSPPKPKRS